MKRKRAKIGASCETSDTPYPVGISAACNRMFSVCIILVGVYACISPFLHCGGHALAADNASATFDLFCMFPRQVISPATGNSHTWMHVDVRAISNHEEEITLEAVSESNKFAATVFPAKVKPRGDGGTVTSRVDVRCTDPNTPQGMEGWIKIIGTRQTTVKEQHSIWLKVTALSSKPTLEKSKRSRGYLDPDLQTFVGKPISWNLRAVNSGAARDTYALSYEADFPCRVEFYDARGRAVEEVTLAGVTRNYLSADIYNFTASVMPEGPLPENAPQTIRFILGPGKHSTEGSEISAQVINPGMLYCVNGQNGLRPHAHQIMQGEQTSFIFHVSNTAAASADITLTPPVVTGDWQVSLEPTLIAALESGKTVQATLTVIPGASIKAGDRLDLKVSAASSLGEKDNETVSVEVAAVPNVYYWSIDSMDPQYLYLNRNGTGPGAEGDWLMPNIHAFISEGVNYTDARSYLPSATDMNHTSALAGSYPGTVGIYTVDGTPSGFTEHGETLVSPNTVGFMRYGSNGAQVKRIYEVAKEETDGKSLTGFWSNKNWLAVLEGEAGVDIVSHSNRWPLFFDPPEKYTPGDPQTDDDPDDPVSGPMKMCYFNVVPGQYPPGYLFLFNIYSAPFLQSGGATPGDHAEDRYIVNSFLRSIKEEDPDVSYINIGDLDQIGHFEGSSYPGSEWDEKGTASTWDDESRYSPWMRRDDCLDTLREADVLFGDFTSLLKERGVYDNSIIVFFSDHGMENMKSPLNHYEIIDIAQYLRKKGVLFREDYYARAGTIYCNGGDNVARIEKELEDLTVNDPDLGEVHPLQVINRQEMLTGADFGAMGSLLPGELYSEFWITSTGSPDGELWPDLFIFGLYNYQIVYPGDPFVKRAGESPALVRYPETFLFGFPGTHGGLQTSRIPLVFKAPKDNAAYARGKEIREEVRIGDITPAIYKVLGWKPPENVDGQPLPSP